MTVDDSQAAPMSAVSAVNDEIATLPPAAPNPAEAALDPRTGEPRRPWTIRIASAFSWLAAGTVAVALLGVYWGSIQQFEQASWIYGQALTGTRDLADLILREVLLSVGLTLVVLAMAVSAVITGYYAWHGYAWTRWAGIISGGLSLLGLLISPVAWAAIPLAAVSAAALWLPPASTFFDAWTRRRHPTGTFAAPVTSVSYGPLPRYRTD